MSEAIEKALAEFKSALDAFRNSKKTPEQIEKAKELYDSLDPGDRSLLEYLFPELAESEDERVRKAIVEYFKAHSKRENIVKYNGVDTEDIIAYLEKQKEPLTPEEKMNHPLYLEGFDVGRQVGEVVAKPAEWSEEDIDMFGSIRSTLSVYSYNPNTPKEERERSKKELAWFNELYDKGCPQPHWKPSEEQMNALDKARNGNVNSAFNLAALDQLYIQLKKLM